MNIIKHKYGKRTVSLLLAVILVLCPLQVRAADNKPTIEIGDYIQMLGRAADFWVEGVPVATVADYAEKLLPGRGGIGRYPKDTKHPKRVTGWVHIDTRAGKSRWTM